MLLEQQLVHPQQQSGCLQRQQQQLPEPTAHGRQAWFRTLGLLEGGLTALVGSTRSRNWSLLSRQHLQVCSLRQLLLVPLAIIQTAQVASEEGFGGQILLCTTQT